MIRNKCEFTPPGSKSKTPAPTNQGVDKHLTTEAPLQDLTWFDKMVQTFVVFVSTSLMNNIFNIFKQDLK